MRAAVFVAFVLSALLGMGCSGDTTTAPSSTSTAAPCTSTVAAPATETFPSILQPGGYSSHGFIVCQAGTVSVTLTALGEPGGPANLQVGLGLGIPAGTTSACSVSQSINAGPRASPQITTSADVGTYCVAVYDLGTLTAPATFSITIVHP